MQKLRTLEEFTEGYFRAHPDEIDDYLTEIFQDYAQDNNTGALLASLRVVARVRGISDMAERVGMTRQGVQKALSGHGNPRLENITSIMKAMGYCLVPQKLPQGTILDYLMNGINNLVDQLHQDWQLITRQPSLAGAMGNEESLSTERSRYLLRELLINRKEYQLKIDYKDDECSTCIFQLSPKQEDEKIPKGFKIRLLTEDLENFPDNVKEAEEAQSRLEIGVKLEAGERIAWSIEPTPDNFKTEILPPFWNN